MLSRQGNSNISPLFPRIEMIGRGENLIHIELIEVLIKTKILLMS